MKGEITDTAAVAIMIEKYARLCAIWDAAREGGKP
jgi:5-dehydro-2-deoxygluconokinase